MARDTPARPVDDHDLQQLTIFPLSLPRAMPDQDQIEVGMGTGKRSREVWVPEDARGGDKGGGLPRLTTGRSHKARES